MAKQARDPVGEIRTSQIGSDQVGASKGCVGEICPDDNGMAELGADALNTREPGFDELGAGQVGINKIRVRRELHPTQVCPGKLIRKDTGIGLRGCDRACMIVRREVGHARTAITDAGTSGTTLTKIVDVTPTRQGALQKAATDHLSLTEPSRGR